MPEAIVSNLEEMSIYKFNLIAKFVGQTGYALKGIASIIESLQALVQQVASASEEISITSEMISGDIASITEVAKQTSAGSDQIAHSSADLAKLSSGLQSFVSQFKT